MVLSERSKRNLAGTHPAFTEILVSMEYKYPIIVTEGLRSIERQKQLVEEGKSKTLNSRHLTGHAIDFAVVVNGKVTWQMSYYKEFAKEFIAHAKNLGYDVTWGGNFKTFRGDGTHLQLSWKQFPLSPKQKTETNSKTIATAAVGVPVAAMVPEILNSASSVFTWLGDISPDVMQWLKIGTLLLVVLFIISERHKRIEEDGV